MKVILHK